MNLNSSQLLCDFRKLFDLLLISLSVKNSLKVFRLFKNQFMDRIVTVKHKGLSEWKPFVVSVFPFSLASVAFTWAVMSLGLTSYPSSAFIAQHSSQHVLQFYFVKLIHSLSYSLFYCCEKTPSPRRFTDERDYLSLQFQRVNPSMTVMTEHSCKRAAMVLGCKSLPPDSSAQGANWDSLGQLPPTRPHCPILPQKFHQLGFKYPNTQAYGSHSHSDLMYFSPQYLNI